MVLMSESPAQEALSAEAREIAENFVEWWGTNVHFAAAADPRTIRLARAYLDLAQQLEQDGSTIRDLQASEKRYHDLWRQAEQRIKKLEKALEIAVSCVGNYAADSNLGEALAAVGINRHPEEDSDGG
jgi:phage shock protein A